MLGEVILPSADYAERFYDRKPGSAMGVAACIAVRALLMSGGIYLAGVRGERLVKSSIYASLAIEAFVIGYVIYRKRVSDVTA